MDLILNNANVITMDSADTRASAVAVQWDKIFKVGENPEIGALASADTKSIDLGGKTVLPGFIDTHNHLCLYGYLVSSVDCRSISGVETIDDIIDRLRAEASRIPPGEWVKGWGYAHYHLKDNRPITREDLDRATTEHPILVIQVSGHAGVVNSKALEIFGYTKDTPDPPGGAIRRDPDTGEPNGILDETAVTNQVNMLFMQEPMAWPSERKIGMIETAVRHYNEAGITSLHEAYVAPPILQLYQEMEEAGHRFGV